MRVITANESGDRLAVLHDAIRELGHTVVASGVNVDEIARTTVQEQADVALVALGGSSSHALSLIQEIVREAECPVITVLPASDQDFVREAARIGVFAYIVDPDTQSLRSALDIVLLRFAEYHGLEGAFGRRALIERAKGVLMERHGIAEGAAFEALRSHARSSNKKLVDVAQDVLAGRMLLPPS